MTSETTPSQRRAKMYPGVAPEHQALRRDVDILAITAKLKKEKGGQQPNLKDYMREFGVTKDRERQEDIILAYARQEKQMPDEARRLFMMDTGMDQAA